MAEDAKMIPKIKQNHMSKKQCKCKWVIVIHLQCKQ